MSTARARRRIACTAGIALAGLVGATFVPTAASADPEPDAHSYASAQLIGLPQSLLAGLSTEDLAYLDGVELSHYPSKADPRDDASVWPEGTDWADPASGNSNAVSVSDGIDATLLGGLSLSNIQVGSLGLSNLGDLLDLNVGALTEYTKATRYGSSVGFAGTASAMEGAIDALNDGEPYNLDARYDPDAPAASLGVDAGVVSVNVEVGALYALARDNRIAGTTVTDSAYGIAGVKLAVGGDLLEPTVNTLNGLTSVLGINLKEAGLLDENGRVLVDLDQWLRDNDLGSINELPEGTNLLTYLPQALVDTITNVVTALLGEDDATLLDNLSAAVDSGLLESVLSGLDVDLLDDLGLGGVADLVDDLLGGILGPLLGGITDTELNDLLADITGGINDLLDGLAGQLLTPLTEALAPVIELNVNNVDETEGNLSISALEVNLLDDTLVLPLASATVGPNEWSSFEQGDVSLSGDLRAGSTIRAELGDGWLPEEVDGVENIWYDFQWYADGEPIMIVSKKFPDGRPAVGRSVRLTEALAGKDITVGVTPHLYKNFSTQEFVSGSFGSVESRRITTSPKPSITGKATVGSTLTADLGTVTPAVAAENAQIVWYRDGNILRGRGETYEVKPIDSGGEISFRYVLEGDDLITLRGTSSNVKTIK